MRAWLVVIAVTASARADDRVFVPSVAAGVAVGGSMAADAPSPDGAAYTAASLAWESRARLSITPTLGALGVWHNGLTPLALAGGRVDLALSPVALSAGLRAGIADDVGGVHPAWDATFAVRAGDRVRVGAELAITGWRGTMMMGGDPMRTSVMYGRLGLSLAMDL